MRIERTGDIPALTPRVERFLKKSLGGIAIDEIQSHEELRIDYLCLRGLLAVELKTLEEDGSARMSNLTDELSKRDDWPLFLGSAPIQSFINNTNDPEGLRRRVLDRIGRGIINHLKKANKQLEAHYTKFPRGNAVGALVIVNEDHEIYDPHTVVHILAHALRRTEGGKPLYEHVDLVIYLTERHAQIVRDQVAFPVLIVEGLKTDDAPWKSAVGTHFIERWATWNGIPLVEGDGSPEGFSTIDHIPEEAPRHERWRTDYRRNPYLQPLTFEQLRERFDEIMLISNFAFLKGSPFSPPRDVVATNMAHFTHMMEEMAKRAIPVSSFRFEAERQIAAAKRLGLPASAIDWLAEFDKIRPETG